MTVAAAAAIGLQSTAAGAGSMSLTFSGITPTVEVQTFQFVASKSYDFSGGTVTPLSFGDLSFVGPESVATPQLWVKAAAGTAFTSVVLTVVSPATGKTASDWTFTDARLVAATASAMSNSTGSAQFRLAYGTVTYRVYAADGTVAQQTCWNVTAGAAC